MTHTHSRDINYGSVRPNLRSIALVDVYKSDKALTVGILILSDTVLTHKVGKLIKAQLGHTLGL